MLFSFSIFDTAAILSPTILSPAIQLLMNRERHYNPRVADALDKMEAMVGFRFKSAFMFINVLNDSLTMSFNKLSPERFLYCIPKKGYTDNDGWLTQLLVMKHGNIGEVRSVK